MMKIKVAKLPPNQRQILNGAVIVGSVLICLLLLPTRLPGMEFLGIGPNWLLIWVVTWSMKRTIWQGMVAGLALGLIQDGMTALGPSHSLSLVLVGVLTARIQKQRYIQEDFISVALIVFGMVILAETVSTIQFSWLQIRQLGNFWTDPQQRNLVLSTLSNLWHDRQQIVLASAILSSLWAPILYYPLNRWWSYLKGLEQFS
jgi:rod shape-determining protein MreD